MRKEFEFTITYFKESGKWYTQDKFRIFVDVLPGNTPYMAEAVKWVEERRVNKDYNMPGLFGTWYYYILIDCEEGYPVLIMPEGVKNEYRNY